MTDTVHDDTSAPGEDGPLFSYAFAERLFYAALKNGVDWTRSNPGVWDTLFRYLDDQERALLKRFFDQHTPTIRLGYARRQDRHPIIAVTLLQEEPEQDFLGEDLFQDRLEEQGLGRSDIRGVLLRQRIGATVFADHPDVALYLYQWVDYVLRGHLDWFVQMGLVNPHFVSGAEITPEMDSTPELIFSRQQVWEASGFRLAPSPIPPPARSVYAFAPGVKVQGREGKIGPDGGS